MGWSIGYDSNWQRDIGYGVPAVCDHPKCDKKIDRGLAYVCGGEPYGGESGCGLFFCYKHLVISGRPQLCPKCYRYDHRPYKAKPDVQEWTDLYTKERQPKKGNQMKTLIFFLILLMPLQAEAGNVSNTEIYGSIDFSCEQDYGFHIDLDCYKQVDLKCFDKIICKRISRNEMKCYCEEIKK